MVLKKQLIVHASMVSAQSTQRIEDLLQEDKRMRSKRELYQKQSVLLSKLMRTLSIHDNRTAAAAGWSNSGAGAGNFC